LCRPLAQGQLLLGEDNEVITQSLGHKIVSQGTSVAAKAIWIADHSGVEQLLKTFTNDEVYFIADKHYFRRGLVPHNHKPLLASSHECQVRELYWLTYWLTYWRTYWLTYRLTYWLAYWLTYWLTYWLSHNKSILTDVTE
jgi:hypothetical protein